jgi:hypothetical protein
MDYEMSDIGAGLSQSTVIDKNPEGAPRGNTNARTHGLNTLKDAVTKLGSRALDGRSSLSYALKKWRRELVDDLGGDDNISTQQSALIDLAVKSKLLLDSIDAWLLTQPTLINKRKRSLLPVVLQRQQLADGFARYLNQLGMERRHKTKTLDDILNEDEPVSGSNGGEARQ